MEIINRFFRSNSSASSRSSIPNIPEETEVVNSKSYELSDVELGLGDCNIPKIPINQIYKSSWSLKSFKQDYQVKIVEQVYGINKEYETCYLFTPATIKAHKNKGHNFQTHVWFLVFDIHHGLIKPIDRAIQFVDKFPNQILDKTQLQRFIGSLNHILGFYQNLRQKCKPLFDRLQTNPPPWTPVHTSVVQEIKKYVETLLCLGIPSKNSFKIV